MFKKIFLIQKLTNLGLPRASKPPKKPPSCISSSIHLPSLSFQPSSSSIKHDFGCVHKCAVFVLQSCKESFFSQLLYSMNTPSKCSLNVDDAVTRKKRIINHFKRKWKTHFLLLHFSSFFWFFAFHILAHAIQCFFG